MENFFIIHDFHNGGQLGKNGNCNIRARPVMPQQNKHGRVSNVGRRARCFSFLFKKRGKQVQNQIFSGHFTALVSFIIVRITREEPLTERCTE